MLKVSDVKRKYVCEGCGGGGRQGGKVLKGGGGGWVGGGWNHMISTTCNKFYLTSCIAAVLEEGAHSISIV